MARQCDIPLSEEQIVRCDYYRPDDDSEELRYLLDHRERLGGFLPRRDDRCTPLPAIELETFHSQLAGSGERQTSTTSVMVRILATLMRHPDVGKYIVPIVPDEARTFGLEALFREAGIYSPQGQHYRPVDGNTLLPYREEIDGQILQEGICETGAMASFLAAGTAYATHGIPTIPFYMFYSIFGFQRVGDMIWACGDMLCRGFLLGGTAGRTTLNGEGLQHQDGHSQFVANTVPNLVSYDPAFGYELAIIIREGIRRMYTRQENVFYYLTLYNETYAMPSTDTQDPPSEGILKGMYRYGEPTSRAKSKPSVHLFGSGSIMQQVLKARDLLKDLGMKVTTWSVTSYNELYRDAMACERWNRLHAGEASRSSYIEDLLASESGVFVAASDYIKALPNQVAPWIPGPYTVLGTDGYGVSESREALRAYFEVSPEHIALAACALLHREGALSTKKLAGIQDRLNINPNKLDPAAV